MMAIPAVLQEFGVDPGPIIRDAGLRPSQLEDPETRLPYLSVDRLLGRCAEVTGCEHFGLRVGEQAPASSLGVAGFMLQTAPDVRMALRDLVAYLDLHDDGGVPFVDEADDTCLLGYAIQQPGVQASDQVYDLSMVMACNIMRTLCGAGWRPVEVLLSRAPPRDLDPYRHVFRAPLRFNAGQSALVFSSHWLDHPLPGADPLLHRHLEQEARALRTHNDLGFVGRLRGMLRKRLSGRQYALSAVASQIGLHERTLNRRLREEGTSYRRVLDEVRFAVAQQLLGASSMTVDEVATALDYADSSAFIRAFRRWSGETPAKWRANNRSS
jgi:AraC-like DNA-binding protein